MATKKKTAPIVFVNGEEVTKTGTSQASLDKAAKDGKVTRSTVTKNQGNTVTVTYTAK